MPPDARIPRPLRAIAAACALIAWLGLGACTGGPFAHQGERPERELKAGADAEAARTYLAALAEFATATPARQAEILAAARRAADMSTTTLNRLKLALYLALPGHAGADPVAARRQLSELMARPEWLLPAERALAGTLLREVEDRLALADAKRHWQEEADKGEREREKGAALTRRLQAEADENARLRHALEDAQKKLDAVSQLERTTGERAGSKDNR